MIRSYLRTIAPPAIVDAYRAGFQAEKAAMRLSEDEQRVIADRCQPGCVALDVGANLGGFTWHLSKIAAQLHAFEPIPFLASQLRCAFLLNRKVHIHNVALSDRTGHATLRLPIHHGVAVTGLATVDESNALSGLPVRAITVPLQRLDDRKFRSRIGFVKIDVEGHELALLRGSMETLKEHKPDIFIEIGAPNMRPVTDLLGQLRYQGTFRFHNALLPVEQFDERLHQPPEILNALRQSSGAAPYVANFLFTCPE